MKVLFGILIKTILDERLLVKFVAMYLKAMTYS